MSDLGQIECNQNKEEKMSINALNTWTLHDLPELVVRKIIKMLNKTSRDNLRLVCRWLSSSVVKLDASYRNLKIPLNLTISAKKVLKNIKEKESYVHNAVNIHFLLKCDEEFEYIPFVVDAIIWEWKESISKLSIQFGQEEHMRFSSVIIFKNLKHLQISSSTFWPYDTSIAETVGLIDRHAQTLKTLRIIKIPKLKLGCKKLPVLEELTVVGLKKPWLTSLLKLSCETLIHLDLKCDTETDFCCLFPRLKYFSSSSTNSLIMAIINQCAHQLIGLKIYHKQPENAIKELDFQNLKFLYMEYFMSLPKSLPSLEYLQYFYCGNNKGRLESTKLMNLKALIIPYYDVLASKVIRNCRETLDLVHLTAPSGSINNDVKALLPPFRGKKEKREWLLEYVNRNPIYSRMLKTAEDENKFENYHGLNEPEVKSPEQDIEDEYEYGNQCYEDAMSRIDEHEVFVQECKALEEYYKNIPYDDNLLDSENEMPDDLVNEDYGDDVHKITDNQKSDFETLDDLDDEFEEEMLVESVNAPSDGIENNDDDINQELLDQEFDNEDNIMIDLDDEF